MSLTQPGPARAAFSEAFQEVRDVCQTDITRGAGGRAVLECYADQVDDLLRKLFAEAGGSIDGVSVIALGGYGRRHLCLHSDIDLLVLFEDAIGPAEERFLRDYLHPLWDCGVVVGHHVRELHEFNSLEIKNPEFLLALLDARLVAGSRDLFERMGNVFHQASTHGFILGALLELVDARHAQFNGTLYQLEPDLKDSPGGLRDLTATRTIAMLTDPLLLRRAPAGAISFDAAEDFLLRIRSVLHLECGRNQNQLSHELQERAAEVLGYTGSNQRQRVERLMSDYFRHARIVSRSLEWARRVAPVPVGPNLGLSRDGISFMDPVQAARNPATWLNVFQAAIDHGADVADEALSCIQQHAERYRADDFFPGSMERQSLMHLLKPKPGLYDRLSEMHDCGLLGRLFPEFQSISWRVVRDFYHKYTVDEHTLLTVRNLERLIATEEPGRLGFASVLRDLRAPELLVLALLYHDVGKWRDDEHAIESVRMADIMLQRLQLSAEEREVVLFLIRNHLRMSLAAFRRDTDDPEVVRSFAALVGTEERLQMLALMTMVDVEAVSPETLTPWKSELLWRFYVDTYNYLTQRYGDDLIERSQAGLRDLLDRLPADVSPGELEAFLEGLPQRYLSMFSPETIFKHVSLARDIGPDEVHVALESSDGIWTLAVATRDKPLLFSNTCGVLSFFGMNILRGHAFTNPNGLVLDVFQFTDDEQFLAMNSNGQAQLGQMLQDAVSGRMDISNRLRGREHSLLRAVARFDPVVRTDNTVSGRYTIVDIVASNSLGLLHRISRAISTRECTVELVLIATEGERAIDVFHITKAGAKLTDPEQQALKSDLYRTLEVAL
jgi:[protein-PII] uridylyltransferase